MALLCRETAALIGLAAVVGLAIGSFASAWVWRIEHGRSIVTGRSACPLCGRRLRTRDLVPVVSWTLLRGRCHACGGRISPRYAVAEAATAALFIAAAAVDGPRWVLLPHALFMAVLVAVCQADLEVRLIPDAIVLPATAVGLPLTIALGARPWWEPVASGLGAATFLMLIAIAYRRLRGSEGLGGGDIKLSLLLGVYLGSSVLPALFFGFLGGALFGVIQLLRGRAAGRTALPFAPFLAVGALVGLFAGQALLAAYLELIRR